MRLMSIYKFNSQMEGFKKHTRLIREKDLNWGYAIPPGKVSFMETEKYNEKETGIPAVVLISYLIDGFFAARSSQPSVFVEESWRTNESGDIYIELKAISEDGWEGIFDVWHWGRITKVKFRFDQGPEGQPPKLLRLEQVEIVARCLEEEIGEAISF